MGTLAAGIKEIFATAKTTGSNVMLCGNDGTPDGHMTMGDLASVLGVEKVKIESYADTGESKGMPKGYGQWIAFIPKGGNYNYVTHLFKAAEGDGGSLFFGISNSFSIIPEQWHECTMDLPSFYKNYADLSSLANALGVTKRMEFVDLGLPSGTLWATRNLGAETPEDYGYYFSWGNVVGRKSNGTTFDYNWGTDNSGNYASTPGAALTGDIPTNMDYDAVQRYMGGSCKMPTTTQFAELFNSSYTTNEWTTKNGVNGRLVTSKINGNSIFFPAAGDGDGTSLYGAGSGGYYWSRSLFSSAYGYFLGFNSSGVDPQNSLYRFYGFSVRAVQ